MEKKYFRMEIPQRKKVWSSFHKKHKVQMGTQTKEFSLKTTTQEISELDLSDEQREQYKPGLRRGNEILVGVDMANGKLMLHWANYTKYQRAYGKGKYKSRS